MPLTPREAFLRRNRRLLAPQHRRTAPDRPPAAPPRTPGGFPRTLLPAPAAALPSPEHASAVSAAGRLTKRVGSAPLRRDAERYESGRPSPSGRRPPPGGTARGEEGEARGGEGRRSGGVSFPSRPSAHTHNKKLMATAGERDRLLLGLGAARRGSRRRRRAGVCGESAAGRGRDTTPPARSPPFPAPLLPVPRGAEASSGEVRGALAAAGSEARSPLQPVPCRKSGVPTPLCPVRPGNGDGPVGVSPRRGSPPF